MSEERVYGEAMAEREKLRSVMDMMTPEEREQVIESVTAQMFEFGRAAAREADDFLSGRALSDRERIALFDKDSPHGD